MKKNLQEMEVKAINKSAILESHDGEEFSLVTVAKNVLCEDGTTMQDYFDSHSEPNISTKIVNSNSMSKVGQGDNVDFSDNVMNGAYEDVVLKGKSLVNVIQEPSSQDVVLPYAFEDGQYVTINDTKESGALGVELKGQTLVNVLSYVRSGGGAIYTKTDDLVTVESNGESSWSTVDLTLMQVKKNTKYIVIWDSVTISNEDYSPTASFIGMRTKIDNVQISSSWVKEKNYAVATVTDDTDVILRIHATQGEVISNTTTIKGLKVFEYQEGMENWDIPYFEGMQSVKMPILHSINQMFDYSCATKPTNTGTISFANDGRTLKTNFEVTRDCVNVTNITLPVGTYNISYKIRGSVTLPEGASLSSSRAGLALFRSSEVWSNCIGTLMANYATMDSVNYTKVTKTFTFDEPVTVSVVYHGWNNSPVGWCELTDIRIVPQGKSSTLSLPEEVVLGGLGNTRDTFNTTTGKYTKRTDTMTVTNYKNSLGSSVVEGAWSIVVTPPNKKWQVTTLCVSDKFSMGGGHSNRDCGFYENPANFVFFDKTVNSADEFIAKYGDFSFTYMLEIPVVTKINLPSTLKSWNTTTHIYSEIPENTLYPILSHSNPTYPVILKPSTKYSIVASSYSNGHTNSAINFNLGGATASTTVGNRVTTITTPSTLSNELLTMSGRGNKLNNVMVIEGDVAGDEPYFEGMCDSKSPILSNVGKNLFDERKVILNKYQNHNTSNGNFSISTNTNYKITDFIRVKPNTKYDNQIGSGAYYNIDKKPLTNHSCGISIITTPSDAHYVVLNMGVNKDTSTAYFIEAPQRVTHEPYKSNILSCNGDKIELTEDMFEQGTVSGAGGVGSKYGTMKENSTVRLRSKDIIKVKPNTNYRLFRENGYDGWCVAFDSNQTYLGKSYQTETFTTDSQTHYIVPVLKKTDNSTMVLSALSNFTLSEVDKTIVLRSLPNGVCDTLNVKTGEYVQNIGEVVLDGSEDERWAYNIAGSGQGKKCFNLPSELTPHRKRFGYIICDCMPTTNTLDKIGVYNGEGLNILIDSDSNDVGVLKEILANKPITVQYQLATPIVKQVNVEGYPYAYENGHVLLESGSQEQSLTPTIEYSIVANRGGQIRSNQRMVERHQKKLDSLYAMTLVNMIDSQYKQVLMKLKSELGSEVRTWDIE